MSIIKKSLTAIICCFILSSCIDEHVTYIGDVATITPNYYAFAAIKTDGSVVAWGERSYGGDISNVSHKLKTNVSQIFSTKSAFAALKNDGSVVTWGDSDSGGTAEFYTYAENSNSNDNSEIFLTSVADKLTNNITYIYSNAAAFAALKNDGSVVTWGSLNSGGGSTINGRDSVAAKLTNNVTKIYSTLHAFAALKSDGSVVTWGDSSYGGSSPSNLLSGNVIDIYTNENVFVALKSDGSVVTWGNAENGGDKGIYSYINNETILSGDVTNELSSNIVNILSTNKFFAAVKTDGSVIFWGTVGDIAEVADQLINDVSNVYAFEYAFAALKTDGSAVFWKNSKTEYYYATEEDIDFVENASSILGNDIVDIYSTNEFYFRDFTVLKADGSLFTWGNYNLSEADEAIINDNDIGINKISHYVTSPYTDMDDYVALKSDGSVITWDSNSVGFQDAEMANFLASGVVEIYSNNNLFVALKENGLAITWMD
ncbi:hypothetical protein [uncultured Psychrosphaera sp.]|uniref:hypothetical protein n=1 Tax=uncultured Psychrosphaera sp. TaxID=1403522 RepID=UPI0026254A93|nr:hypothetical protein [uncultured Psychrosphaera sp.]